VTVPELQAGERRRYWLSLAALVVVLPAAVLAHTWGSLTQWWANNDRDPIEVERGTAQPYAGAEWRMTGLSVLPIGSTGRSVVLAEFEARIEDPAVLMESPCVVALTDAGGRRWQPRFTVHRIVREQRPEAAEKPNCGGLTPEQAPAGATVKMAETFVVPADVDGLALSLIKPNALPGNLVLR
jgi:hypothetical protein